MIIDLLDYAAARKAEALAATAALEAAQRAEFRQRVNLEWILADLIADIEAA